MTIEVKVPRLPESVSDATLVSWHRNPGDRVKRDENLADLETDKVVLEVPAPAAGVLREIMIKGGTTVTGGQLLAVIEESAAEPADDGTPASTAAAAPAATAAVGADDDEDDDSRDNAGKLSPAVRRLVDEHDLDPRRIAGSGRGGRILKSDVLDALAADTPDTDEIDDEAPPAPAPEGETEARPAARSGAGPTPTQPGVDRQDRRVRMTRLRARIAERMVEAQQTAAMLTTFNEADLGELMALRKRYGEQFQKQHGVKLGFMGFFVQAVIEGLRRFPAVNASVEGDEIVYHDYHDIGIAVSTDRGLVVPILRDADQLSLAGIEKAITAYGEKARAGSLSMEDLTGGTFTITNGGIFGSMLSTPILNPPQSGILGMHRIQERPVAVEGQVVIRSMMYLALSYDHRIVDGREAVQFLVAVKEALEDPRRLLLNI